MDPTTISALIGAGGGLTKQLGDMLFQSAQERRKRQDESTLMKGRALSDMYQESGKSQSNALQNLIAAYRASLE